MESLMNNWLWTLVVFPIIIGVFKTELGNIWKAWRTYQLRAFDADGNPATSDRVQLLNGATGEWGDAIIEKYKFTLNAKKRGVYLLYPDGGREKVSFLDWAGFRKRVPPA